MGRAHRNDAEVELLYRQHGAALLLFALAICGDRGRAQDAVHHVFLRVLENESLSNATNKKAYLFACVRNAVFNEAKLHARSTVLDDESAWFHPPHRDYIGEQNLRRALLELADDQRQVVVLHLWGDLTFSEIAGVLEISPHTAASRYRYALARLRVAMSVKETPCAESRG